jgi:hypothetical protein
LNRIALMCSVAFAAQPALAGVTKYTIQFDPWAEAAGSYSTITFAEFGSTAITNQYAPLGVNFTGPDLNFSYQSDNFPQDGWGLDGNSIIELTFDKPINAIAFHFPASLVVNLWSGGQIFHTSDFAGSINQKFGGLYSDQAFDRVWFRGGFSQTSQAYLDNLYFSTIPTPGALGLLGLWGLRRARRRGA